MGAGTSSPIFQRILKLPTDPISTANYGKLQEYLKADDDVIPAITTKSDDAEILNFFIASVAKEIKFFMHGKSHNAFPPVSTHSRYTDPAVLSKISAEQRESALIVLSETVRAITIGHPLEKEYREYPTLLFLYFKNSPPQYSGHIFVKELTGTHVLFFVSIYKSLFETVPGISDRILTDVEKYAKDHGAVYLQTIPLENMMPTLFRRGFYEDSSNPLRFSEGHTKMTPLYKIVTMKGGARFWPHKYYAGLSRTTRKRRRAEIRRFGALHWKDPAAYVGFRTDRGVKTRRSGYTADWKRRFPDALSLEQKAAATGVPVRFLRESYNRGMAAWRTGHRPGATQQQWGYARVHSLLLCGKTARSTDSDLRREAIASSASARRWFAGIKCS